MSPPVESVSSELCMDGLRFLFLNSGVWMVVLGPCLDLCCDDEATAGAAHAGAVGVGVCGVWLLSCVAKGAVDCGIPPGRGRPRSLFKYRSRYD